MSNDNFDINQTALFEPILIDPVTNNSHNKSADSPSSSNSSEGALLNDYQTQSSKIPFTFGKCKICCDKATGIHYGIATCEGCKGFYKRSLDKYPSYFCFHQGKCQINKVSRNRCKSCRFKKCLREGMSIDGIKMGRIPKLEKLKASIKPECEMVEDDDEDEDCFIIDKNTPDTDDGNTLEKFKAMSRNKVEEDLFRKKQFETWFSSQIEYISKNNISQIMNKDGKKLNSVILSLDFRLEPSKSVELFTQPFDILRQHHLFDSSNILPNTIFKTENELFRITLIKDKVYQLFKTHLAHSNVLNNTSEKLKSKDYIDSSQTVTHDQLLTGLVYTLGDFAKWLTRFAKELPGFNKLNLTDFSTMISSACMVLYGLHVDRYFTPVENYIIISNNIQVTKNRCFIIFGSYTELIFEFHNRLSKLNLSENELSIFYAYILTSCNADLINEKQRFFEIKNFYTKALIYEFELNRRDSIFFKDLKQLFDVITVMEINKENIFRNS